MISIATVEIVGDSERGPFSGRIDFEPGLQVFSAPNRYGKSLAFSAITWCLGVEQIFGALAGDNSIFPSAARSHIDLANERAIPVLKSEARLFLSRDDKQRLALSRPIIGGELTHITYDDGKTQGTLQTGWGSSADSTAGFQGRLRSWAGLPEMHVLNSRGQAYPIYLENLAALFLIEQTRGWGNIQAEQVYRYGLLEIANAAFEHLLGLDARLRARLARQKANFEEGALREEARSIAEDFTKVLARQGWSGGIGVTGSLKVLASKWANLNLHEIVKEQFHFDFNREQQRLKERLETLRAELGAPNVSTNDSATRDASQKVVGLKGELHGIQKRIGILRSQLREQQSVLHSVEDRWSSARDLLRLKKDGIGVLPSAECPTCHQSIEPARLQLQEQSIEVIEIHVESLDRQRGLLRRNVDLLEREMLAATADERTADEELRQAESALRLVNVAVGGEREAAVKLATDIIAIEREMDKNRLLNEQIGAVQQKIDDWCKRAAELEVDDSAIQQSTPELVEFEKVLRQNVVALGVGGVTAAEAANLHLGQNYEPLLGKRGLPAYGSASDRARLVLAYTLALLAVGKHHPGFGVFDEPVQQNPDPHHRELWLKFIGSGAGSGGRQRILFTSLRPDELEFLRQRNVKVQEREGRFLDLN